MCGTSLIRPPSSVSDKKVLKVPKEKEKRRNSEKRKEKSRDAARCRRGKESEIFNELLSYVPLTKDVAGTLDKMSILRLSLNSLRLEQFVAPFRTANDKDKEQTLHLNCIGLDSDDPVLNFFDGFVLILTDDGEQLAPIFASDGVQTEMGLPVAELLGVSLESYVHPCDYQELRTFFLDAQEKKNTEQIADRTMQIRMKCTISAKGRVVNIKSAAYKVVKFQLKSFKRSPNDVLYMSAICEPMGPFFAKLRPTRTCYFTGKTGLDFSSQHGMNLIFKSMENLPSSIGFNQDELKQISLYNLIHPADMMVLSGHFKELFNKGYCDTGFYRFLARRGGYVWISTRAQLVHDTSGKPLTIQCVHYALGSVEHPNEILADFQQPNSEQLQKPHQIMNTETSKENADNLNMQNRVNIVQHDREPIGNREIINLHHDIPSENISKTSVDIQGRHVLIFVPSGTGTSSSSTDSGALSGNSHSAAAAAVKCCSVVRGGSAPSGRQMSGGPFPVAGVRALGLPGLSQQNIQLTATYVNVAELNTSQTSPVAVVGQSKNNQLDNNNTAGEQAAVSASLPTTPAAAAAPTTTAVGEDDKTKNTQLSETSSSVCSSSAAVEQATASECLNSCGFSNNSCSTKTTICGRILQERSPAATFHSDGTSRTDSLAANFCGFTQQTQCARQESSEEADSVPDLVSSTDEDCSQGCPQLESESSTIEQEVTNHQLASEEFSSQRVNNQGFHNQGFPNPQLKSQLPKNPFVENTALTGTDHLLGDNGDQLISDKWSTTSWQADTLNKNINDFETDKVHGTNGKINGDLGTDNVSNIIGLKDSDNELSPQVSVLTSTLSVFAPRTEEMSPGFLQVKGGQVLTCEEPGADLTHLAPTAGDSAMPLEVEFEVCDEIPENLFPSLLDSAGCSPLSNSPPYDDPLLGCSDLPPALLDDLSDNLQLEADSLLLPSDWHLPGSSLGPSLTSSVHRKSNGIFRSSSTSSNKALNATSKSMLAALLQSELVPSSVSQKQRAMVHDWGGTTQPLPESMQLGSNNQQKRSTPVKFVPQKVQSTLTINALKRPLSVSQRNSIEQSSQRSASACPLKRRKTIDSGEQLTPKPIEKTGSVLMKLLMNGEDLSNGYSCRVLPTGSFDKDKDLRSAQDYLHSLTSQHDHAPGSVSSDTSDFCHLLSADDDLLLALAAVTQE